MRYVRPREYRLNPRAPIKLLDPVEARYSVTRFTFTEDEALAAIWAAGEDVRLREDPRFWQVDGPGHFHLARQMLANEKLADRLWQGLWDGEHVEAELARLDAFEPGGFHVFCPADPRFQLEGVAYQLLARTYTQCPPEVATRLDLIRLEVLNQHRSLAAPRTTRELLELATQLDHALAADDDSHDHLVSWLSSAEEWTEIARGLWLPSDLVPVPEEPKRFRVPAVLGQASSALGEIEFVEAGADIPGAAPGVTRRVLPDPPVERHPDASAVWTHVLRTVHLYSSYLPVPSGARFRYPRFVGHDAPIAIHALNNDTGQEGFVWLDRQRNRFFGDFLRSVIEFEEAGRRYGIRWTPQAIVLSRGELDAAVQDEERRFADPQALETLRHGLGENYRQSIIHVLRGRAGGVIFRQLYDAIALRVGYRPSRRTIRAVLNASPDFVARGNTWLYRPTPDAGRVFRRNVVLTDLGFNPDAIEPDIAGLARAIKARITDMDDEYGRPQVG